ncbi:MAG: hypothetical protein ACLR1A_04865 [Eubacterium ventriosum]|jgi:hypothetical protein|nr:MAG TPA: hypothetical protein [Caudoviricetes sp.]
MNNIKVTLLSIEEVKKKIFDNDIDDVYVLTDEDNDLNLRVIKYNRLDNVIRRISDGSAFLKIEVIKDDDRTEK